MQRTGILYATASTLGWGLSNYLAGLGTLGLDADVGVALSLYASTAWALLVAILLAPHRAWAALSPQAFMDFALVGCLNFPLARALLYAAIRDLGPSRAMALRGVGPVFAVLLAALLGQGWPSPAALVAIALMVLGAVLLGREQVQTAASRFRSRGFALGILAAIGFGAVPVLVRAALPTVGSPLVGVVVALAAGAVVQTAVVVAAGRLAVAVRGMRNGTAVSSYLFSGILSGSANTTSYLAVSLIGAAETSALASAAPLVTLLASRILRRHHERLTRSLYAAGVLVVLGGVGVALAPELALGWLRHL